MQKKKLLDIVREQVRLRHYSMKTETTYIGWIKRYIFFHQKKHPVEMGKTEIEAFLIHLAVDRKVGAAYAGPDDRQKPAGFLSGT